ncbi:TIP41-like protein [Anneissia japonica]|uniref:TIP41-like protein n=1 Tax=Anneissia japonica TaxID=1529436 RepID=UPI0014259603|nr:TIP41-like protein [Anneissia japonica]XP_033107009.1 TIP41-like protein [Anneissia japonica]
MTEPKATKKTETFSFGPWTITSVKGHILKSVCQSPQKCSVIFGSDPKEGPCVVCRYQRSLELPQLPEMVFGDNVLRIEHQAGFGIEFNALDALKLVDAHQDLLKVAVAKAWQEARKTNEFIKEVVKPFDWTYTTDYKGTCLETKAKIQVIHPTDLRIDVEKLKVREKIYFFDEIVLFEDELADNGCAMLTAKLRVMQTSFFVLLRFYLRVDGVLIRINDTRFYHEADKNYIIREYTSREKKISELKVSPAALTDANQIHPHLDVTKEVIEKLEFPPITGGS